MSFVTQPVRGGWQEGAKAIGCDQDGSLPSIACTGVRGNAAVASGALRAQAGTTTRSRCARPQRLQQCKQACGASMGAHAARIRMLLALSGKILGVHYASQIPRGKYQRSTSSLGDPHRLCRW